ncbi:MAG: hypothetical protein IJ215_00485 [Clostridia bacterium]|nr:hypothetical protein [Clostridia bacterium]
MSENKSEKSNIPSYRKNKLGLDNSNVRIKGRGIVEDDTEYGEFIATFDAWLTPEEQKRRAKYLENLGREE